MFISVVDLDLLAKLFMILVSLFIIWRKEMGVGILPSWLTFKYRDRATIIGDILISLSRKPEGKRRTNIKQSANLSGDLLNKYLDLLLRNGYVIEDGEIYKLTSRGLKLLQNLDFEYLKMRT